METPQSKKGCDEWNARRKERQRVGVGNPGVSAVCPPAYLWLLKLLDRGRGALSGADRGVEPRCDFNRLGGKLIHRYTLGW